MDIAKRFSVADFLDRVQKVENSSRALDISKGMILTAFRRRYVSYGKSKRIDLSNSMSCLDFIMRKPSIIDPQSYMNELISKHNKFSNCFIVSVVILLWRSFNQVRKRLPSHINTDMLSILDAIENATGIKNVTRLSENKFKEISQYLFLTYKKQLVAVKLNRDLNAPRPFEIWFKGDKKCNDKVHVLLYDEHAYAITDISKILTPSQLCKYCGNFKPNDFCINCSRSKKICRYCRTCHCLDRFTNELKPIPEYLCDDCNVFFIDLICYFSHKKNNVCGDIVRCRTCARKYSKLKPHRNCGLRYCRNCRCHVSMNDHTCYLSQRSSEKKFKRYIIADIESVTENAVVGVLFCLMVACPKCLRDTSSVSTLCCGERFRSFLGRSAVNQAVEFIFLQNRFRNSLLLMHGFSFFDGSLVLHALLDNGQKNIKLILNGRKILQLSCSGVVARDSYNILPFSLDDLSRTFKVNHYKGFFPYRFLTCSTLHWMLDDVPPVSFFEVDKMKSDRRRHFEEWYASKTGRPYNVIEELKFYCFTDVIVLSEIIAKFVDFMTSISPLNPFYSSLSLASYCLNVFLSTFFPGADSTGELPIAIYSDDNSSVAATRENSALALKYLSWLNHEKLSAKTEKILTASNRSSEARILNKKVDGFAVQSKRVYEIFGCWIHACVR